MGGLTDRFDDDLPTFVIVILLVFVLPIVVIEAPWLLALVMVIGAFYWWQTGAEPISSIVDSDVDRRSSAGFEPADAPAVRDEDDSLATLRLRYARGEIDDEEFERRLDRLLATERDERNRERGHDPAYER